MTQVPCMTVVDWLLLVNKMISYLCLRCRVVYVFFIDKFNTLCQQVSLSSVNYVQIWFENWIKTTYTILYLGRRLSNSIDWFIACHRTVHSGLQDIIASHVYLIDVHIFFLKTCLQPATLNKTTQMTWIMSNNH